MPLPLMPFDGQIFIDAFRVQWRFDGEVECWRREGQVPGIPVATAEQPGLLSAENKNLIDTVQAKGGGFGIVVDPKLAVRTGDNPDGLIFGDVEFLSNSLDIKCVHTDGREITEDCQKVPFAPEVNELPPGFDINFKEELLKTLCAEIPGGPGPKGNKGPQGDAGAIGTGDGPVGETGEPGVDATEAATFSGIKIEEIDDIFDTAVVSLELDADEGKLHVVKANIRVPDDDTPVDKVIVSPVSRSLEFTGNGFTFNILKPAADITDANVTIANYPPGFEIDSDIDTVQPNATKLSAYINKITDFFTDRLDEISTKYDKDLEEFFKNTDEAARQKLDILGEELANCEFRLPLEYCIGINPQDCQAGSSTVGNEVETQDSGICVLADSIFEEGTFCDEPPGQNLGAVDLEPNEENAVKFSGQATLPKGGYLVIYSSGTFFDSGQPGRGHYVGTSKTGVGIEAEIIDPGGASTIRKFPEPSGEFDKFDEASVVFAYQSGPLLDRSIVVFFAEDGGSILLKSPAETEVASGRVSFTTLRCQECIDPPIVVP